MKSSVATLLQVVNYSTQSGINENQLVCAGIICLSWPLYRKPMQCGSKTMPEVKR